MQGLRPPECGVPGRDWAYPEMETRAEAPGPLPPAGLVGHTGRLVVVGLEGRLVVVVEGHVTPVGVVVG